jgi:hypothetical protein
MMAALRGGDGVRWWEDVALAPAGSCASWMRGISREERKQGERLRSNSLVSAENGSTDFRENSYQPSTAVQKLFKREGLSC